MKRKKIICMILAALSSPSYGAYVFSDYDWITNPSNGHLYALTLEYSDWLQAEAWAVEVGGHLVTIDDEPEDSWLISTYGTELETERLWIGFYQDPDSPDFSEPDGGWVWISGKPVNYTNWADFEPNNQPKEDFSVYEPYTYPIGWNDWGPLSLDYYPTRGIIEIPEPATLLLLGLGGFAFFRKRSPRKL